MHNDLEKWLNFIEKNQNLYKELLISKMGYERQKKSLENFIRDKFIPEAENHGFHFSFDDVVNFSKAHKLQELSADDLQDVVGGVSHTKALFAASAIAVSLLTVIPVASIFKFNIDFEKFSSLASSFSVNKKADASDNVNIVSPRGSFSKMAQDYVKLKNSENNSTGSNKQSTSIKDKATEKIKAEGASKTKADQIEKLQNMQINDDLVRQLRVQVQDLQRRLAKSQEELENLRGEVKNYKALVSQTQKEALEAKSALKRQTFDKSSSKLSEQKSQIDTEEIQDYQIAIKDANSATDTKATQDAL